jgi:hypothetical protein
LGASMADELIEAKAMDNGNPDRILKELRYPNRKCGSCECRPVRSIGL